MRDSAGAVLTTLASYSNLDASDDYVLHTFDLAAYRGSTVQVAFQGVEDGALQTSFLVDDASLTVTR